MRKRPDYAKIRRLERNLGLIDGEPLDPTEIRFGPGTVIPYGGPSPEWIQAEMLAVTGTTEVILKR